MKKIMWILVILVWVFIIVSMFWVIPVVTFESELETTRFTTFIYITTFIGTVGYLYVLYRYCGKETVKIKKEV